jgi:adenylate cyclase
MAKLKILRPSECAKEYYLVQRIVTIGRSPENTIQIPHQSVSPVHASIVSDGNTRVLIDHSSESGTFVDDIRVERKSLCHGNRIRLGEDVEIAFMANAAGAKPEIAGQDIAEPEHTNPPISDIEKEITLEEAGFSYDHESPSRRAKAEMQEKYLSTIYQVNQTIIEIFDLRDLSNKVLDSIFQIFPVDRAAVILYEHETQSPRLAAFRTKSKTDETDPFPMSQTIVRKAILEKTAILARDTYVDARFRNVSSIMRKHIRSVLCVPLHTKGRVLGALYADSLEVPARFSDDDLRLLLAVGGALANAIENATLVEKILQGERKLATLERYLPSVVVEHLLSRQEAAKLGGRHAHISVLFADIRNFTPIAEKTPPADVVSLLNEYFSVMSDIVFEYEGTLGEYIGDEIMAYFGAPIERDDHASVAISVALKMRERMGSFKLQLQSSGLPVFDIGIGIATGPVVAGNIGSAKQMKYTIIGNTVNLAHRLCSYAKASQILICPNTHNSAHRPPNANLLGPVSLKGISAPTPVFELRC